MSELDREIAEKVMGWALEPCINFHHGTYAPEPDIALSKGGYLSQFKPSTDIQDAWLVVERMVEKGAEFNLCEKWGCEFQVYEKGNKYNSIYIANAETAPLAICKAALKAVKGDV